MNRFDRFLQRILASISATDSRRVGHGRFETVEPAEGQPLVRARLIAGYVLAVALPAVTAAATIPLRGSHTGAAAVVLVLAVGVVAAIGTTGPALLAAVWAGVIFDLLLTKPYYRLAIYDGDDLSAAISLVVVGVIVGVLSSRLASLAARNIARRKELHQLVKFIQAADVASSIDELSEVLQAELTDLLGLASCDWSPDGQGGDGPWLLSTGSVMGPLAAMNPDRAVLPEGLDLPVEAGPTRLGHLILSPQPGRRTSIEERLTAATMATVFAGAVARLRASSLEPET